MQVVYTGELVRIRPFASIDEFAGLNAELNLEDEYWGLSWWPLARMREGFEQHAMLDADLWFSFQAIDRLDTGELIGYEVIQPPKGGAITAEIGTGILRRNWHRGFGREAKLLAMGLLFENFPLAAVSATTLAHHRRAIAGILAIGMRYEGAIRFSAYSQGRWAHKLKYVIFREEWEQLPIQQGSKRGN
jgi:RimJ/RimL family protein N-acetyltransferase